jgi:hypothetical protein
MVARCRLVALSSFSALLLLSSCSCSSSLFLECLPYLPYLQSHMQMHATIETASSPNKSEASCHEDEDLFSLLVVRDNDVA